MITSNLQEKISNLNGPSKLKKWTWFCIVKGCKVHGFKPMRKTMARKNGKNHLQKKHGIYGKEVILKPVDKDWQGCRYEPSRKNKIDEQKVDRNRMQQAVNMVQGKVHGS